MAIVVIQMIPLGLAAAVSPVPIMTGISLTGTRRPTAALLAYLLGGLLAYVVIGVSGVALVSHFGQLRDTGHPSKLALSIDLVIGLVFLVSALVSLKSRSRDKGPPRWMSAIEGFGPGSAFLVGIVMLSPHVKNLLLLAAALSAIGAADLGPVRSIVAILFFMALALAPVLIPLGVHLTQPPQRAAAITGEWKGWLERNNGTILAVVFGVMGLKLILDGLAGLLS